MEGYKQMKVVEYLKLLRVKHYIKNLLVFIPIFFAGEFFQFSKLGILILGFVSFCLVSSAIYILNDIKDVEKDRRHPTKKNRPIASGKIKKTTAIKIMIICLAFLCIIMFIIGKLEAAVLLMIYFVLNVMYSLGLKNVPILDIAILASGFIIRIFYGGAIADIEISKWLYLVVTTGSLYMGLGKRRNELKQQNDTRKVLQYYSVPFLDKNMYVCVALTNVFYALWTFEMPNPKMSWTVPIFIIILMFYSLDTEKDSDGDPVEVILNDKFLIGIVVAYAVCIFLLLYVL